VEKKAVKKSDTSSQLRDSQHEGGAGMQRIRRLGRNVGKVTGTKRRYDPSMAFDSKNKKEE